jgi:exosortase
MSQLASTRTSSTREGETTGQGQSTSSRPHFFAPRNLFFLTLVALSIALFWGPLKTLFDYATRQEHKYDQYSHTLLIPLVSLALAYSERKRIFARVRYSLGTGGILLFVAVSIDWFCWRRDGALGPEVSLSITILGLVIFWIGGFIACYGRGAFRAGLFALLFLVLTVPLPALLLNGPVTFVQQGSADVASFVFGIFGVPVFRNGVYFTLPGLTIEIAKECSGIHSLLALFIISLLAGHLSLLAGWKRVVLVLLVFPIICLTNGLRISALALLTAYVDPRIIFSSLHRDGGFLFFGLAMVLLAGVLYLMGFRRQKSAKATPSDPLSVAE